MSDPLPVGTSVRFDGRVFRIASIEEQQLMSELRAMYRLAPLPPLEGPSPLVPTHLSAKLEPILDPADAAGVFDALCTDAPARPVNPRRIKSEMEQGNALSRAKLVRQLGGDAHPSFEHLRKQLFALVLQELAAATGEDPREVDARMCEALGVDASRGWFG